MNNVRWFSLPFVINESDILYLCNVRFLYCMIAFLFTQGCVFSLASFGIQFFVINDRNSSDRSLVYPRQM